MLTPENFTLTAGCLQWVESGRSVSKAAIACVNLERLNSRGAAARTYLIHLVSAGKFAFSSRWSSCAGSEEARSAAR